MSYEEQDITPEDSPVPPDAFMEYTNGFGLDSLPAKKLIEREEYLVTPSLFRNVPEQQFERMIRGGIGPSKRASHDDGMIHLDFPLREGEESMEGAVVYPTAGGGRIQHLSIIPKPSAPSQNPLYDQLVAQKGFDPLEN